MEKPKSKKEKKTQEKAKKDKKDKDTHDKAKKQKKKEKKEKKEKPVKGSDTQNEETKANENNEVGDKPRKGRKTELTQNVSDAVHLQNQLYAGRPAGKYALRRATPLVDEGASEHPSRPEEEKSASASASSAAADVERKPMDTEDADGERDMSGFDDTEHALVELTDMDAAGELSAPPQLQPPPVVSVPLQGWNSAGDAEEAICQSHVTWKSCYMSPHTHDPSTASAMCTFDLIPLRVAHNTLAGQCVCVLGVGGLTAPYPLAANVGRCANYCKMIIK